MDKNSAERSNNPWAAYVSVGNEPGGPEDQSMDSDFRNNAISPPSYSEATGISPEYRSEDQKRPIPLQQPSGSAFGHQEQYQRQDENRVSYTAQSHSYNQGDPRPIASSSRFGQDSSMDDELMAQALHFTHQHAPPSSSSQRLPQPVAVPQIAKGIGLPFARAYSLVLQNRGISMEQFVEFIDNLNVVSTGSPPLQILDLAGGVVSMVPHHIPQLVGSAISLSAKLGTAGVSKGRSTIFLKKANSDFFAPRGLKVEVATAKALKAKLGLDPEANLVSALGESEGLNVQQRRLRALEGYISPLTFDVPPPNEQTNALEKMGAWQVKRQLETSEKKALKDRKKAEKKGGNGEKMPKAQKEFEKEIAKIEKDRNKARREYEKELKKSSAEKAEKELQKEMRKLDKEVEKAERVIRKETVKDRKDMQKEDKEVEQANKVLWMLIEDL